MKTRLSCSATGLLLASLLPSQTNPNALPRDFHAKSAWRFPIHTQAADPIGGEYGTWAAGPDYKVSFHDGYAFYPVLGASYPQNLPWSWRDTRVSVGEHELVAAGETATRAQGEWRYEYRYAAVTEAYDVREDGVEQTFVIAQKPVEAGDLVVRGRVATELRCEPVERRHGALVFRDANGNPIVSYGAAFAIDASGTKYPMTTSYVGGELALTLAATSLANAAFPLTVDPLTASVVVATGSGTLQEPEIARDDLANQLCFAYSRTSAGADSDNFVRITADDYSGTTLIFSDVTASWSTRNNQVAFVGGVADKWIVVFQRDFATSSAVRFVVSPSGSLATVTAVSAVATPAGTTHRNPDVGGLHSGASTGSSVLVVYQSDTTATNANTANTEVYGRIVDLAAAAPVIGAQSLVATSGVGPTLDRERPAVIQVRLAASHSWLVVWQEFNNALAGDDWDVYVSRVSSTGVVAGQDFLAQSSATDHALAPRVEGQNGRYMATYAVMPNLGFKYTNASGLAIECQRFDWLETTALPTKKAIRTLAGPVNATFFIPGNIAYDTTSDSHWAITYTHVTVPLAGTTSVYVERCGYTGGTVEAAVAYVGVGTTSGYSPSVTFDDDAGEFKLVLATTDANNSLYARSFRYQPNALNVGYGVGCGGVINGSRAPNAGDEFWAAQLSGARPATAAALLIAGAPGNLPLDFLGMTSCTALVDLGATYVTSVNALTSASGRAAVTIPLLDYPAPVIGDVWFQWVHFAPGANAANLLATGGMRVQVR